jgi:hypothetical protein
MEEEGWELGQGHSCINTRIYGRLMGFRKNHSLWNNWQGSMRLLRTNRHWVKHKGAIGRGRSAMMLR